ncbi:DAK2 domain-containing protein [uncultured Marinococcus sp.]|uniref:DAK2 domain-containing protein n=1 Tax=uncultured Marinococcus sp. TaxID=487012 RepID=UPI0026166BFB|nr:DAK2 domain-containing protein [uncultured Marinococcus sp.]
MDQLVRGPELGRMLKQGASALQKHSKEVDAMNVFPVPDGDTGTNMSLTIRSGVEQLQENDHAGDTAKRFSKGLLMGARGNSGVILSQLFRGFAKSMEKKAELRTEDVAEAFEQGVDAAYRAVMKPVEGTILTVAREASLAMKNEHDAGGLGLEEWMRRFLKAAKEALAYTPEQLPVLKEVGVVDSGGQGLVYIYEGMLHALTGEEEEEGESAPSLDQLVKLEHHKDPAAHGGAEAITYGYCTEVMVRFAGSEPSFQEEAFREELSAHGDSLLVVCDEELLKVHIHAEEPGKILEKSQRYGELIHIKIENMREQNRALQQQGPSAGEEAVSLVPYGFVTVTTGDGIAALFESLGVQEVVHGGQSMNPSTEDLLEAVSRVQVEHVFLLPNNGNIVMAAEQAADISDKQVTVIPTKTVPQGLAGMLAFDDTKDAEANKEAMKEATRYVKSGQITHAVRETSIDGKKIQEGDFMGIWEKDIVTVHQEMKQAFQELLAQMVDSDSEIITLISGEDVSEKQADELAAEIEQAYPDLEIETHTGGQPLYQYIVSVE